MSVLGEHLENRIPSSHDTVNQVMLNLASYPSFGLQLGGRRHSPTGKNGVGSFNIQQDWDVESIPGIFWMGGEVCIV